MYSWIVALIHHPVTGETLSWAVTAAGVAQCLWLFWSCRQAGLRLGWQHIRVTPEVSRLTRIMLPGEVPSAMSRPPGCAFHPRCAVALPICRQVVPPLVPDADRHAVACHNPA